MKNNEYPLILVFYLNRSLMENLDIIEPFANSVNDILATKNANAIAFFIPTDGEEKVDCINPVQVSESEIDKVYKMVDDIKKSFDIGQGADDGINDIDNDVVID